MHIWQGTDSLTVPIPASTLAIGSFDGVHQGHCTLISAAVKNAQYFGRPSIVFTFDRHPAEFISPDTFPGYLTTPQQRMDLISDLGVDHLVIAHFNWNFRETDPETFLRDTLVNQLGAQAIYVGEDFRFGKNQAGDIAYLQEAQERMGFKLNTVSLVQINGEKAASRHIRQLLMQGDIVGANKILGHRYSLSGIVDEGQHIGRTIGYPTANLRLGFPQVTPADGIYATWAHWQGGKWKGATSIGKRPTVKGKTRTIETYLMGFSGNLYGAPLDVEFVERIREERKFSSLDELKKQIALDVLAVEERL